MLRILRGISFCRFAWISQQSRGFCSKRIPEEVNQALPGAVSRRYQVFDENQSPTIFDVEEERARVLEEEEMEITGPDPYEGIDLSRGKTGVFEIEDLVELLRKEKGKDIFVCQLSPELKYVDYLCVATALSTRHMRGLAEFVRKVYKMKRHPEDKIPKIEGETCRDWIAMDMGNIALHIFSAQARKLYDLESLWTLGPEYDAECNKPIDPQHFHLMQLLGQNTTNLGVSK